MTRPTAQELRKLGEAHLGRLLLQALRRVEAASVAKLHQRGHTGVRTGHIPVFSGVAPDGVGGNTRISDLAARGGITRQMMGRLVRELEEHGYVATSADPTDQRAVVVEMTARGWQFCRDAQEVMAELEVEYAGLLGGDRLGDLRRSLTELASSHRRAEAATAI